MYLTGKDLPALPGQAAPSEVAHSGEYTVEMQVLLGRKGFWRAALMMLDYVHRLPPGQQTLCCVHGGFELWHSGLPYALQLMAKLDATMKRGTRFVLVNRLAEGLAGSPWFSLKWLAAHMRGTLRSRHYEGEPPPELFVAAIPGYWSGRVERDDTAEDGLLSTLSTDPRGIRRDVAHCEAYIARSIPASQYDFLSHPGGYEDTPLWAPGPLPAWDEPGTAAPDGSFEAVCRVPGFGIMTRAEFAQVCGRQAPPPLPDWLFPQEEAFAAGPHRILLCREDVHEGLAGARRQHEALSALLGRRAYVPREMLAAQLRRLLAAMARREDFEVALVPRSAFKKLEIELVYWRGSAAARRWAGCRTAQAACTTMRPLQCAALPWRWSMCGAACKRAGSVPATWRPPCAAGWPGRDCGKNRRTAPSCATGMCCRGSKQFARLSERHFNS